MPRSYERKTDRRSREERRLSVRAEHRASPDQNLLAELMIRFALQDAGKSNAGVAERPKPTLASSRLRS